MGQDKAEMKIQAGGPRMVDRLLDAFSGCGEILLSVRDEKQKEELLNIRDEKHPEESVVVQGEMQAEKQREEFGFEQAGMRKKAPQIRQVTDPVNGAGPLAGIVASLRACREEWLFVAAVDMPYMDKAFADDLFAYKESGRGQITQTIISEATGPHHYDTKYPARTKRAESDIPDAMEPFRTERAVPDIPDAIVPVNPDGHVQPMSAFYNKKALPVLEKCLQCKTYSLWRCFQRLQAARIPVECIPDSERKLANLNRPEDVHSVLFTRNQ